MTSVNLYTLYCTTEQKWVETFGTSDPIKCPNDHTHVIEPGSQQIMDTFSKSRTIVEAPTQGTNGNYRAQGFELVVAPGPNVVSTLDVSFPYSTSVRSTSLIVTADNLGDHIEVISAPNTTIGVITAPFSTGDVTLSVSPTVTQHINPGYIVTITDGTNTDELGECISVDRDNNTITVDGSPGANYSPATPTYVQITVPRIKNMNLLSTGKITLGGSEIGGTINPANNITRVIYTNKSGIPKTFNVLAELFY